MGLDISSVPDHVASHFESLAEVDAYVYALMERRITRSVGGEERKVKAKHVEQVVTPEDEAHLTYAVSFSHDRVVQRLAKRGLARLHTPLPPNARPARPERVESEE